MIRQSLGYGRVSFSRKGVEGLKRVFPDDMEFDSQAFEPSVLTSIRRGFSGMKNCTEELGIVRTELARFPVRASFYRSFNELNVLWF